MSGFRLRAKRFFLTFPQCDVTKEVCATAINDKWKEAIECYAICKEHHAPTEQDPVGGPHLHMVIHFKDQMNFSNANCFDFITGTHGNYQVQKGGISDVAKYLTKEDKTPLCFGIDLDAAISKKKSIFGSLAEMIKDGKTLDDIDDQFPGAVLQHKRKLEEYEVFQAAKRRRLEVKTDPKRGILTFDDFGLTVEIGVTRPFRTKQFFITGPTGTGKTTFINSLHEAGFRGYPLPIDGKFDEWSDDLYDFAYIDEFNSQLTLTMMNQFLDGQTVCLTCRYQNKWKKKNVPCFILTNKKFDDLYPNTPMSLKDALASRLHMISLWELPQDSKLKISLEMVLAPATPTTSP